MDSIRPMNAARWTIRLMVLVLCCSATLTVHAAEAKEIWIGDLEDEARLEKLVGQEVQVTGRFNARLARNQIKLRGITKIELRLTTAAVREFPSSPRYITLVGTITRPDKQFVMTVKLVAKTGSEVQRYRISASQIERDDHEGWRRLADFTEKEAEFYRDDELKRLVGEARQNVVLAHERSLTSKEYVVLYDLAFRATRLGISSSDVRRMRHTALRWESRILDPRTSKPKDYSVLAAKVKKMLSGAGVELKTTDAELLREYNKDAIRTYNSTLAKRDLFDRFFWLELKESEFRRRTEDTKADLLKLSQEVRKELPERRHVADEFLRSYVRAEQKRIEQASQMATSHVRKIAGIMRDDLKEPERARQLISNWLDRRRTRLPKRDAEGRVQLAREYLEQLSAQSTTERLLKEAWDIQPETPGLRELFAKIGMIETPDGWIYGDGPATQKKARAMRFRLPQVGMTRDQAAGLLLPKPEHIVRIGTGSAMMEQWRFPGPTEIYVTINMGTGLVVYVNTRTAQAR